MLPLFVVVPRGTSKTFSFYGRSQAEEMALRLSTKYDVTLYVRSRGGELQEIERLAPAATAC